MLLTFIIVAFGCFPPRQINENKQWARKIGGGVPGVVEWILKQEQHVAYADGMGALVYLAFKRSNTEEEMYNAFKLIKDARISGWRIRPATVEEVPYLAHSGYDQENYNVDAMFWGRFYITWARSCMAFDEPVEMYERLKPAENYDGMALKYYEREYEEYFK
jgi:hypothetical protein